MFSVGEVFTSRVGSPAFMAPEVFKRSYTQSCDVWSSGITMYFLLCGYLPFDGKELKELETQVLNEAIQYKTVEWVEASMETLAFLELLLKRNPRARYTIDQAFHHDWLKPTVKVAAPKISKDVLEHLRTFRKANKLKRSALIVCASMLKTEDVVQSHKVFKSLDLNGDGQISLSEMRAALAKTAVNAKDMFGEDQSETEDDQAKPFSYTEFIAATFDRQILKTRQIVKAAFACYDKDGDGCISMAELAQGQLLGDLSMEEVAQTLEDLDRNKDCYVDLEEFGNMLLQPD
jgi:calcium-dependent protein kinase